MIKKRKIYIFTGATRAAVYGIGTYIEQLTQCLNGSDLEFSVVDLFSDGTEVSITEKPDYKKISIPKMAFVDPKRSLFYYNRNVAYLLKEFIPEEKGIEYIFHLNFMTNQYLIQSLKKHFKCKIILTVHYTNWSFALLGDYKRFKTILSKEKKQLDNFEKQIVTDFSIDKKMMIRSDRIICVAKHTFESTVKCSDLDPSKIKTISNALKDEYQSSTLKQKKRLKNTYHISENVPIILFAGRLDDVKGVNFLIQSFKNLLKTYPQVHLFIAGDGDFSSYLKETVNISSNISFLGRLEKKKLFDFYCMADIGIVCSLHEEFGFVAIEMMMHALPVIVTNTGGLAEIVEDNVSGLKIPIRMKGGKLAVDTRMLTSKLQLLLDDPILARKLGEGGRQRFLEKYEISTFKEKMLNLYQNI